MSRVDEHAVLLMKNVVTGIASFDGRIDAPTIWSGYLMASDDIYSREHSAQQRLVALSKLCAALSTVINVACAKEASLRDYLACRHRACTITDLPDEILRQIFSNLQGTLHPQQDVFPLALASRRLYEVALDSPQLWTCISSADPLYKTAEYLTLSKAAMLRIKLTISTAEEHLVHFWQAILPSSSRWKEVHYCWDLRHALWPDNLFTQYIPTVPALSSLLCIHYDGATPHNTAHPQPYSGWHCVALTHFKGTNTLPLTSIAGSLVKLTLLFRQNGGAVTGSQIIHILQFTTKLRDLTLEWLSPFPFLLQTDTDDDDVEAVLPELTSLHVSYHTLSTEEFGLMFSKIAFPNLNSMFVNLGLPQVIAESLFGQLFRESLPHLHTFELRSSHQPLDIHLPRFMEEDQEWYRFTPSLRNLCFRGPGLTSSASWFHDQSRTWEHCPPIRSVIFENCYFLDFWDLRQWVNRLVRHQRNGEFRRLEIIECPKIRMSKKELKAMLPDAPDLEIVLRP